MLFRSRRRPADARRRRAGRRVHPGGGDVSAIRVGEVRFSAAELRDLAVAWVALGVAFGILTIQRSCTTPATSLRSTPPTSTAHEPAATTVGERTTAFRRLKRRTTTTHTTPGSTTISTDNARWLKPFSRRASARWAAPCERELGTVSSVTSL